jgi:hypothetical protein
LADLAENKVVRDLTAIRNDTFKSYWGSAPETEDEVRLLLKAYESVGVLTTSLLAYKHSEVVGMVVAVPEVTVSAIVRAPRTVDDNEKLNFFLIGVRESERGSGLNL